VADPRARGSRFAVNVTTSGFDINTIGYILLAAGGVGALLSLMFWSSWGGVDRSRCTVVEDAPPGWPPPGRAGRLL